MFQALAGAIRGMIKRLGGDRVQSGIDRALVNKVLFRGAWRSIQSATVCMVFSIISLPTFGAAPTNPIPITMFDQSVNHALVSGSTTWYSMNLMAGQGISIALTAHLNSWSLSTDLYDSAGNSITWAPTGSTNPGDGQTVGMEFTAAATGVYYLKVASTNTAAGTYDLAVYNAWFNAGVTDGSRAYYATRSTASYLQNGNYVLTSGAMRWLRFSATAGSALSFNLTAHLDSWSLSPDVVDSAGNRVTWTSSGSTNPSNGQTAGMGFTAAVTGVYYLKVVSTNTASGSFDLTVANGLPSLTGDKATDFISKLMSFAERAKSSVLSFIADPIDAATGAHTIDRSLLSIQGARRIDFSISYNSLLRAAGPVSYGWGHNYETRIQDLGNGSIVLNWSANRRNTFTLLSANKYTSPDQSVRFDTLNKNGDGSFTLARKNLEIYQFNSTGKLVAHSNGKGQWIDFTYDGNGFLSQITDRISGSVLSLSYNASNFLATVADGLGRQIVLTYDGNQNLWKILDARNATFTYTYDTSHRILTGTDAENNRVFSNTYDAQGRITSQDDALTTNQLTRFNYQEQAFPGTSDLGLIVTTITDRLGNQRVLTHDTGYQLLSARDELGVVITTNTYDQGNLKSATDANGNVTSYTYDARGNMLTVTDPKNRVTTMTYDAADNLLSIANSVGKKVTYTYDAGNRVLTSTDALNRISTYSYNANGQLATVTDPKNGVTTNAYTGGRLQNTRNPVGDNTSFTYDSAGRVLTVTNAAGKAMTMAYDGADNLLSVTNPLGRRISNTWDSHHNRLAVTDPRGNTTSYTYNANGKLTNIRNALNQNTIMAYDGEDRLVSVTDARGNTSSTAYDAAGRPISSTDALSHTVVTAYDTVGNVSTVRDANNIAIQTNAYDSKSYQPLTVKDALLNTITFSYDALDRATGVLDPLARNRQYIYDDRDRLIATVDPKNGSSTQSFDANGNRNSQIDPNNNQTTFAYDAANRLTGITSASSGQHAFAYANGRIASTSNARGQVASYTYFDDDRLASFSDAAGSVGYTYDANGNTLTITEAGKTLNYAYDVLNRVTQYGDGNGNVVAYTYDAGGNLATFVYPDFKVVTYTYDAANRLTTVNDWAGRVTRYVYDNNGRLVTTTRPDGSVESRTYSAAGQILQIKDTKADGTTMINNFDFAYNAAGNVTTENSLVPAPPMTQATTVMTYGADNRLLSYNGAAITYDADGNMLTGPLLGGMSTMTFDARNRLASAAGTSYTYDTNNNRIGMAGQQSATYVVNPLAAFSQILTEKDGAGAVKAYYVYGLGLLGRQDASDSSYKVYHFDRRGNTVALTNSSGVVTDTYSYTAYGEQLTHTGTTVQPFLYDGRDGVITDANGLYYMRARYYNPSIKRFVNMDSLLGDIGDGQVLNRYAYVMGNPMMWVDPTGKSFGDFVESVGNSLMTFEPENPITGVLNEWIVQPGNRLGGAVSTMIDMNIRPGDVTGAQALGAYVDFLLTPINMTPIGAGLNMAKGEIKGFVNMNSTSKTVRDTASDIVDLAFIFVNPSKVGGGLKGGLNASYKQAKFYLSNSTGFNSMGRNFLKAYAKNPVIEALDQINTTFGGVLGKDGLAFIYK